jgi:hypothetical protein
VDQPTVIISPEIHFPADIHHIRMVHLVSVDHHSIQWRILHVVQQTLHDLVDQPTVIISPEIPFPVDIHHIRMIHLVSVDHYSIQ